MRQAAPFQNVTPALILRELGLAASALALWLLLLLSPLHQVSRALAEFQQAEGLPATGWVLCQARKPDPGRDNPVPQCPLCNPGHAFDTPRVGVVPGLPLFALLTVLEIRDPSAAPARLCRLRPEPRAPPSA